MIENINDNPVFAHKIEVANNFVSCIYCGINNPDILVECGECDYKFCNGISEFCPCSHILYHLKKSNHKSIKYPKKKMNEELYFDDNSIEIITCGYCKVSSLFELYFFKDTKNKKIEFLCQFHLDKKFQEAKKEEDKNLIKNNFKKIIYEEHENNLKKISFIDFLLIQIPIDLEDINLLDDCDIETIKKNEEIIQLSDPITKRFLNKVKDKYESSDDYYEIYKPLIFSEFNYVKRIYDSKQDYPIELYYKEMEKDKLLFFHIDPEFNGINFNIGKRLQFYEEPKQIEELLNFSKEEGNERGIPINFTGVILKIFPKNMFKEIIIVPINRDIATIKENLGTYYMKENFSDIPFIRMLKGLDSFNNENRNNISNLIHSQILGIMDKEQIKDMDEKEMKNIFNENEFITQIDNFGKLNTNQIKCMKKIFTQSLSMVQGPPGTGKTFLAAFIIYNIFKKRKDENDKILVCAPSNSATDNLALYLLKLNNSLNNNEEKKDKTKIFEYDKLDKSSDNGNNIDKNKTNRKMKILRVYSKVREIMETNENLTEISSHTKLNFAIEEFKELKKKKKENNNNEEEEIEDNYEEEIESNNENIILSRSSLSKYTKTKEENKIELDFKKKKKTINENEIGPKKIKNISDNIINEHDIIIATCSTSYDSKLIQSEFQYVLIDEATQCCEIECLLPLVHGSRHVVLIGDQKQLGPTIIYPKANILGMKISLFERMIKIYPDNFIMLKKQYRMNEQLSKFPSDFFYEGKIKNSSKHQESKYAKKIMKTFLWPKKDIPIMFINTNNKTTLKYNLIDEKLINKKHKELYKNKNIFTSERDSGKSYENELEAEITIKILNMLNSIKSYQKGKYDIGIITPYIGQKKLILEKLYLNNLDTGFDFYSNNIINIASVDSFQGKEKDFIIINTVRSNYKKIIGFLKDPRRLNVSLTRARHGLIIIGDAYCLANAIGEKENKYNIWRYLIKYYQDIGVIIDYNEGNQEKMFSLTQILNKDEKLEKYKFIEYDYDGKCNRHNINKDYIDDYGYIKKKDFFHYIDDKDFCINNSLFYDNDFNFDEYYNDLYNEEFNNYGYYNNNIIEYNENSYYYNSNYYNGNYYNSNYNNNHYNRGYY